jgi:cysteinyl-tRNA synthetase
MPSKSEPIALRLYNSLGRSLEDFKPIHPPLVTLYTCGPTIYNFAHIGNLRTFLFEDVLRRSLKWLGYEVKQVMNLTDVDDKTIQGSLKEGLSLKAYTQKFATAFFEDLQHLNIEPAEHYPCATDYIDEMIAMIQSLLDQGYAYQGQDQSIYFAIDKYKAYGRLAQLSASACSSSHSRIQRDEYDKDAVADFVLWKSYDKDRDGQVRWPSPWGEGRPGWHIECSAMARALLGRQIDIHTGGVDNLFPHHENEIAQSECCHHEPLARYWLHSDHLMVEGKKMSKSLGNFYTLRDLLEKGYDPLAVRYLLIQTHYRHSLNFTFDGIKAASRSIERLRDFSHRLETTSTKEEDGYALEDETKKMLVLFQKAIADDLNISAALAALFDWIVDMNRLLDQAGVGVQALRRAKEALHRVDQILGVIYCDKKEEIPAQITHWFEERQLARKNKNWPLSDQLRDQILKAGFIIEDGLQGQARLKAVSDK